MAGDTKLCWRRSTLANDFVNTPICLGEERRCQRAPLAAVSHGAEVREARQGGSLQAGRCGDLAEFVSGIELIARTPGGGA